MERIYGGNNPTGTEVFPNIGPGMCDSTVTINLNVLPAKSSSVTGLLCDNDSIVVNGTVYNAANLTGTEVFSNVGPNMCDSTVTINLTAANHSTGTITSTNCGAYLAPSGVVYTSSGMYMDTIPNAAGCDSVIAINLTITGSGPPEIDVKGNGSSIANNDVSPSLADSTDFGSVTIGDYRDVTYWIKNTGACDLILNGAPILSGTSPGDYTIVAQPSGTVLSGDSTAMIIRFMPQSPTVRNAIVTISNNVIGEDPFVIHIKGEGANNAVAPNNGNCDGILAFDGNNDYVELNSIADSLAGKSNMSIEMWVRSNGTNQENFLGINSSVGNNVVFIRFNSSKIAVYDGFSNGYEITTTGNYADGVWHHVAYTKNGLKGRLYVDGILEGTHNAHFSFASTDQWSLGQEFDGATASDFYEGSIDEVRIWDVTRSAIELNVNMGTQLTGSEPGLKGYYNFNQGYGSMVIDQSTNGNDGMLVNMDTAVAWKNSSGGMAGTVASSITPTICSGSTYTSPANNVYTTTGAYMDTISATGGCDSIISINLTVLPALTGSETSTICNNESITVNGTVYDASNPSGAEIISNVGPHMCDSTVTVNLTVLPALTGSVTSTICNNESITVNGTVYDASNPSGTEVFSNVGPNMCDSTVTVNLTVLPALTGSVTSTICNNESVTVNGTVYDVNNPSGTEVFSNVGPYMCDSTVTVNLTVLPALTGSVTSTICNNESVTVNGTVYDVNNPTGTEVFSNVGPYMCDSTVTVNLTVLPALTGSETSTICNNESVTVNGTVYDVNNQVGQKLLVM